MMRKIKMHPTRIRYRQFVEDTGMNFATEKY